jgi:lysozyme
LKNLIESLKKHEGVSRWAYEDHLGYITVGVGRCLDPEIGLGLSDKEIDYLLQNDIERCYKELECLSWFPDLDPIRQEALVNMVFNLGLTRFLQFKKTLAYLAEGRYPEAADEMLDSKWARQVKNRAIELSEMIRIGSPAN